LLEGLQTVRRWHLPRAAFAGPLFQHPGSPSREAGARKEMALVIEELHVQITATQERLAAAIKADDANEVARHRARLQDLIDMAARHGVDVHAWVDQTLLHN
jgi:hypothetical protein